MGDWFITNEMPDWVEERRDQEEEEEEEDTVVDPLRKLLSLPYSAISQRLMQAGLDLKETVLDETWRNTGGRVENFILYRGTLGTAFLLLKTYLVTDNKECLSLCSEIVKACETASTGTRDGTFICGRPGIFALGAVVAKHLGDDKLLSYNLSKFKEIKLPGNAPDELLYGRAGYLWACLFLNKQIHEETISSDIIGEIVNDIFTSGRRLGVKRRCPLMFEWYGEKFSGAAHGLAGITHVLMHVKLLPEQAEDIKRTLKFMIKYRSPNGNFYPSEQENKTDCLVHWCQGAPGVALTLVKAAEVFGDKDFVEAAEAAADLVWRRGLIRRLGICHGISGNTYVFLALYRLTGNRKYLHRAKAFGCFLLNRAHMLILEGQMDNGENPYSLFEGIGGMSYLFLDMAKPVDARFPGYEL